MEAISLLSRFILEGSAPIPYPQQCWLRVHHIRRRTSLGRGWNGGVRPLFVARMCLPALRPMCSLESRHDHHRSINPGGVVFQNSVSLENVGISTMYPAIDCLLGEIRPRNICDATRLPDRLPALFFLGLTDTIKELSVSDGDQLSFLNSTEILY